MAQIFTHNGKTGKPTEKTFRECDLFPTAQAKILLSPVYYDTLLANLRKAALTPAAIPEQSLYAENVYDVLYGKLISNFAEYVQVLPSSNFGRLGGLLQEGLQRSFYALKVCHEEKSIQTPIWNYVFFSAALLYDLGRTNEDRTVIISSKSGTFIKRWLAHEGSLLANNADFYKIRRGGGLNAWLARRITPLLAYQIMPTEGFKWIASQPHTLNVWLALLTDDATGAGSYGLIFNRIHELLNAFLAAQEFFPPISVKTTLPEDTKLGEEFIEWLKQQIKDGNILINSEDALINMTKEGMLLDAIIFQEFCKYAHYGIDIWPVIFKQFNELGFTKLSGDDYRFEQYFSKSPGSAARESKSVMRSFLGGKVLSAASLAKTGSATVTTPKDQAKAAQVATQTKTTVTTAKEVSAQQAQTTTTIPQETKVTQETQAEPSQIRTEQGRVVEQMGSSAATFVKNGVLLADEVAELIVGSQAFVANPSIQIVERAEAKVAEEAKVEKDIVVEPSGSFSK